jgi:hypothetical protein
MDSLFNVQEAFCPKIYQSSFCSGITKLKSIHFIKTPWSVEIQMFRTMLFDMRAEHYFLFNVAITDSFYVKM